MVPVEQKVERLRELLEERLGHLDTLAWLLRAGAGGGAAVVGGGADGGAVKGNVGIEEKAGGWGGEKAGEAASSAKHILAEAGGGGRGEKAGGTAASAKHILAEAL